MRRAYRLQTSHNGSTTQGVSAEAGTTASSASQGGDAKELAYVFAIGVVADAISDAVHGDTGDGAIENEPGKAALADECVRDVHAAVAVVVAALGGVARGLAARIGQHHVVDAAAGAARREVAVTTVALARAGLEASDVASSVVHPRDRAVLRRV